MAKYCGKIGFCESDELTPGVWKDNIVEHYYFGDITKNMTSRWIPRSDEVNDDMGISNQISIVADAYAFHHFHTIKYIEWMDTKWEVKSIEVQHPRLILEIGGLYNGDIRT